jgi:hypothetical protein
MAELTPADLDLYTNGRLPANEVETNRILQRALRALRSYCEWHVTPVKTGDVVTLDGSGQRMLMLPTQKLVTLTSVVEDGVALNVADLRASQTKPVVLRKKWTTGNIGWAASQTRWSCDYSSIVVTMTHGFTEAEAEDWRLAVLDACDRFALQVGVAGLKRYKVRDVERDWYENASEIFNTHLVEPFRLKAPM